MQASDYSFQQLEYRMSAKVSGLQWGALQGRVIDPIEVVYGPEGREPGPMEESELCRVESVLSDSEAIGNAVAAAILTAYPGWRSDVELDREDSHLMPEIDSWEELAPLVRIDAIYVHHLPNSQVAMTGIALSCTWEAEHGLGLLLAGNKVVEIGGWDTAFLLWVAEEHAGVS